MNKTNIYAFGGKIMQELGKYFLFKSYRAVVIALVATTALRVRAPSACTPQGTPRSPGTQRRVTPVALLKPVGKLLGVESGPPQPSRGTRAPGGTWKSQWAPSALQPQGEGLDVVDGLSHQRLDGKYGFPLSAQGRDGPRWSCLFAHKQ